MRDKPTPKFMKPGDNPELDRLLEKARQEEAEPLGEYYYDMFGRRRLVAALDPEAPTVERDEKSTEAGMMTEMPAGVPAKMKPLRVVTYAMMAIVGPLAALIIGAVGMNRRAVSGPVKAASATAAPRVSGTAVPGTTAT